MNWFLEVLRKYAVFRGRARRKEYWFFFLFYLIFSIGVTLVDLLAGTLTAAADMGLLSTIYALVLFVPSMAVGVRRLHDTDRSGWWLLILLVPLIGILVLIIFFCLDGTRGSNRFGPDPKQAPEPGAAAPT